MGENGAGKSTLIKIQSVLAQDSACEPGITQDHEDRERQLRDGHPSWRGKLPPGKAKVEEVTVNKRKVTYAQAEGSYLSSMPGGPKTPQPNSMLLGVAVPCLAVAVGVALRNFASRMEAALRNGELLADDFHRTMQNYRLGRTGESFDYARRPGIVNRIGQ